MWLSFSKTEKDRTQKIFAFSHTKLMYNDGTTLQDGTHELHVYKVCSCSSSNRSTLRNGRRRFRFQVFLRRFVFSRGLKSAPPPPLPGVGHERGG